MVVQIAKRGQLTLPKSIRETIGISEGDAMELIIRGEELVLRPAITDKIRVKAVPAMELKRLLGLVQLGGDAVRDSESVDG